MKLKNLLYLAQLEEYDVTRINKWLKDNPGRTVIENKKQLVWTPKAKLIFFLSHLLPLTLVIQLLRPFDFIFKYFLVFLALIKLKLFHSKLTTIVITGSWGKTTTKDMLFEITKTKYKTTKTQENFNTLIGISQAILKLPSKTEVFICEAGAYQPGDIRQICWLVKPTIGVITAIGPMHLERFGTLQNILRTKMELAQSLPANGLLLLPQTLEPQIQHFPLKVKNISYFTQPQQIYQTITKHFNISNLPLDISSPHRLQITQSGPITIIDDSYNSNPEGFKIALEKLKSIKSDQKILVTPGMIELGSMQFSENARLAKLAGNICNHIIIVGQTNQEALLSGLKNSSAQIHTIKNLSETDRLLPSLYQGTATVLFENDLGDQYL